MKPGNFKSKNNVVAVTLHNLLFLVRKLVANKLVETFDWLSCRKKMCFCAASRPKREQKHETKKLVKFLNHLHILTTFYSNIFIKR